MRSHICWVIALLAAPVTAFGCSAATSDVDGTGAGTGSGGLAGANASGGTGGIVIDDAGGGGGLPVSCASESKFVYLLDKSAVLFKFDPLNVSFSPIGKLTCSSKEWPYSMAVDRKGHAWVVYSDGNLFQVDTATAACQPTAYLPGQHGFVTFGMGFVATGAGGFDDVLYVSQTDDNGTTTGLGKLDTQSFVITPVGMYDEMNARAELTGTGDGRLYGAFEGVPWVVAEINRATAAIESQAPQSQIHYAPASANFAFAFWGGSFWIFAGGGNSTDVFQYDPTAQTTTLRDSETFAIVGAGVSTCAPLKPPA
jgi:hypothetical protein